MIRLTCSSLPLSTPYPDCQRCNAGLLASTGPLDLTSMTNIAVPQAYNLSFRLAPEHFAASEAEALHVSSVGKCWL